MEQKFDSINLVVRYLRDGILSGTWQVGEKIPSEHDICKLLNVNRNTVRCALAQYTTLGVLKSIHGKGSYVCSNHIPSIGSGEVSDIMCQKMTSLLEFRRMLEPDISYYAVFNITNPQFSKLEALLNSMVEFVEQPEEFVKYDLLFHGMIAEIAGNDIASATLRTLFRTNLFFLVDMHRALGACNAYYYHSAILDALQKRDSEKARQLMRNHLDKSLSELQLYKSKET